MKSWSQDVVVIQTCSSNPNMKGLDISYLRERAPWMRKQNKFYLSIYLSLAKGVDIVYLRERTPWMRKQEKTFFQLLALSAGTWHCLSSSKGTMDAKAKQKIGFHLLALCEGTWQCVSSSKTTMDAKAKRKHTWFHFFTFLLPHDRWSMTRRWGPLVWEDRKSQSF